MHRRPFSSMMCIVKAMKFPANLYGGVVICLLNP